MINDKELSNENLLNSLKILEKTVKDKIAEINNQNQTILTKQKQEFLAEKNLTTQKINELNNKIINLKIASQEIINDINTDLKKIKNIINN